MNMTSLTAERKHLANLAISNPSFSRCAAPWASEDPRYRANHHDHA